MDDEELVIKSLVASIDWATYGFQVAGYALSGAEALNAIDGVKPDLIFTDIRMPGISGLELIKQLNATSCPALMIIISGYAEFALAQKAINYGAFGYCLKPFDEAEIVPFLKKAKIVLQERNQRRKPDFLAFLESDLPEDRNNQMEAIRSAGIDPELAEGLRIVVSVGRLTHKLEYPRGGIAFRIGLEKYAYLISGNMNPEIMLHDQNFADTIKGFGWSHRFHDTGTIQEAIREAEIHAYQYFVTSTISESKVAVAKENALKGLEQAIAENDATGISFNLNQLAAKFKESKLQILDALHIYNKIMMFIHKDDDEPFEDFMYSFDQLTSSFHSVMDMLEYLQGLLEMQYKQIGKGGQKLVGNRTLMAIRSYIDEHYREELTIPLLANMFSVNGNYVSQLFKKETGRTFTEYLTTLRIEYACELLMNSDLTISEIAEKSGYSDYFYFSRLFKRSKGMSPSAYRRKS
ncbi:response regulator transcription factor [Paenibacillus albidus]|uniref:response regulator transcription factor n=1 Tax=Paenibacillus albidus TaxID=2041023 RepID=UPI001BE7B270|nr:helix-turn-helix domain-containing protein [Paenibacillus albidus]